MSEYRVLRRVVLGDHHRATGQTLHHRDGQVLPPPHRLEIEQPASRDEFYLIHYDEQGREMTDSYHETIAGAIDQATWEFGIRPEEWAVVDDEP